MTPIPLRDALAAARTLHASPTTSEADAMEAIRLLGGFNRCMLGLVRFGGHTPWERHPEDELLHVLEGSVDVEIRPEVGAPERSTLLAGDLLVVPRGLWHRQLAAEEAALFFITSREGNETSTLGDPREVVPGPPRA